MSVRRIVFYLSLAFLAILVIGIPIRSQYARTQQISELLAGRNVNMVSGTKLPLGDPWLQRQNEPSGAVSTRNPMHLFFAANDYRTIDMPDNYNLRGIPGVSAVRDAWIGVFESFDGGESFVTMLLPGFPQDTSNDALLSPIHGFDTACDPIVRAGAHGLFYLSGIAFNRSQQAGAVFVARYVDSNNREKIEQEVDTSGYKKYIGPINYKDTKLADAGNPGQFIDMPNMAVDVPRGSALYGNVYLAYTVFLGNTNLMVRSKIVFIRSTDGGATWSGPIKLTESQHIIQRPVIAIDPSDSTGKTIYVVFRRFANANVPGGIVFVKSTDGGVSFSKPADIATLLYPFDQGTSTVSFRTNSYPTMAVDGSGTAYVAWAQRYIAPIANPPVPSADGQARIVISYLPKAGLAWSPPQIVDQTNPGYGHQFMPTITFAGGKLMLAWYDQRDDINLNTIANKKFIEDASPNRHTIDVRAAEGTPGAPPSFQPSIPVSRYLYYVVLDNNGMPLGDLMQGEANFINYPLFELGTKPFHGDYMEIASSPQILPPPGLTASNSWAFNTSPSEPTTFPVAWTDNRNVWPPAGNRWGDWVHYNPPTSTQDGDFGQQNPCNPVYNENTGMKNQNVYTANLNYGIVVGCPGNTKKLDIQRTFVVVVKNTTEEAGVPLEKALTLSFASINGGASASFEQFSPKSSLDITVEPYSSVSTTVYVTESTNNQGFAPVRVEVKDGATLIGYVILNPDSLENPLLGDEFHGPIITNPKVWKYDVGNPNEPNASFLSPRVQSPRVQNSGYVNPRVQSKGVQNPRVQSLGAGNPRVQSENLVNNDMFNPRVQSPRVQSTALTDMTWTVTNDGNTTSAYTFDLLSTVAQYFSGENPQLFGQVLVYKMHTNPIDSECELLETHSDELILNVSNPRVQSAGVQASTVQPMRATTQQVGAQDITFNLAPDEQAEVILRVYDPDINDPYLFDTETVAAQTTAEAADTGKYTPPDPVPQPNIPWVNPLPTIVADPPSLTFNGAGSKNISLSLSNLPSGSSLAFSASVDSSWLSVSPTSGILNGSQQLTVTLTSTSGGPVGYITVTVPEASNNPLRIPVYLSAGNNVPDMGVYAKDALIGDGGICDFGSIGLGQYSDVTFSINNNGQADLILGGKPIIIITGTNANQFSVQQQPTSPVNALGYTTFIVRFAPTSVGQKTAAISIINNTSAMNPYDIVLNGSVSATQGPIAYYPFNGNANDESGNGNNGTIYGNAVFATDRFGVANSALRLNGAGEYVQIPDSPSFYFNYPITLSAWIYLNDNTKGGIVGQWGYGGSGGDAYVLYLTGTKLATYVPRPGLAHYEIQSTSSLATGQWYHVSMVSTGSLVTLYINGNADKSEAVTVAQVDSYQPVKIGIEERIYGSQNYLNGIIDSVRIYNRALSASEIQALHDEKFGQITDPAGDATLYSGVISPDLISATATVTGNDLVLNVQFAPNTFTTASSCAQFLLDTDMNPATGNPGVDASCTNDATLIGPDYTVSIEFYNGTGQVSLKHFTGCHAFSNVNGQFNITLTGNGMQVTIPMALLSGCDGRMNFKVVSYASITATGSTGCLDYMTNIGSPVGMVRSY